MAGNEIMVTSLDRSQISEIWSTLDNMQMEAAIARDATSFLESLLIGTNHKGQLSDEELAGLALLLEGIAGKLRLIEDMASSGMSILRQSEDANA